MLRVIEETVVVLDADMVIEVTSLTEEGGASLVRGNNSRWRGGQHQQPSSSRSQQDKEDDSCYNCHSTMHYERECPHIATSDFYKQGTYLAHAEEEEEL